MSDDAARRAWAYLARVAEPPAAPVIDMIAALGVSEAAAAVRRRKVPDEHREVLAITASRADTDQAQADLDTAERIGARLVTPADDEWPAWSLSLIHI